MACGRLRRIVNPRLDQAARDHQRPTDHREVPPIGPGIVIPADGRMARKAGALSGHGSEEAPRQGEAMVGLAAADLHHILRQDHVLKPCGPGATRMVSGRRKVRRTG
jgi:hypothetical protein